MNLLFPIGISLCAILTSCGIPVITTLNSPASEVPTQPTDYQSLTLNHSASMYAPSDNFLGYNVYYKIYPITTGEAQLDFDNTQLINISPTVAYLTNSLGYHLLVTTNTPYQTSDPNTASPQPTINLASANLVSSNVNITLSFHNLIASSVSQSIFITYPAVTIAYNGNLILRLFRDVTFPTGYLTTSLPPQITSANLTTFYKDWYTIFDPNFWRSTSWSADSDMYSATVNSSTGTSSLITAFTLASGLEVDFFIVAYSFSPTTQTVYSVPVPWGVVHL